MCVSVICMVYWAPSALQLLHKCTHFSPSPLPTPVQVSNEGCWTTSNIYLLILFFFFQITWTPPFCNTFFRQFTVKLIRLQLSSSTFWSCRYALITLITLGCFPSLYQQHIYNHVFVLFHSQSHSKSISEFPCHLTAS